MTAASQSPININRLDRSSVRSSFRSVSTDVLQEVSKDLEFRIIRNAMQIQLSEDYYRDRHNYWQHS